jgi:hypothetical protein
VNKPRKITVFSAVLLLLGLRSAVAQEPGTIGINVPGAGTAYGQGTVPIGINANGVAAGYDVDAGNVFHAFVRASNGIITTFNAAGAGTGAYQGTVAYGLNTEGAATGWYADEGGVYHGYVRAPNGVITTFDAVSAAGLTSGQGTFGANINQSGTLR